MSGLQRHDRERATNPLDLLEQIVAANEWAFERRSDSEMAAEAPGKWCDYGLYFSWSHEISAMHFSCAFDLKVPAGGAGQAVRIAGPGQREALDRPFRHGHRRMACRCSAIPCCCAARPGASAESLEDMVDIALTECERFFPAFQFVLWGGKSPADALQAAMLDCVGEA